MWADMRVDPWFYAMLVVALVSCALFFTKSKWAFSLYLCLPLTLLLWYRYERAIFDHLLDGVPIRIDFPFVAAVAVFPLVPIIGHATQFIRSQKKKESSNNAIKTDQ